MRDVKEKKKAEEALRDSEERYRTLIEEAFDGIFVQRGAKIVFANQSLHDMLGYGDGELIGMDHWLVYTPEYQDITRERAKARMRGEEVISRYKVKLQRKDGSWFCGEINARVISFAGDPGVAVWLRDITESERAEEELQKSEEKYRSILESIEDGYYEVDIAGNFTFFNDSLVRIVGYSEDELMGMNYRQYTPAEDTERMYQAFNRVFTTGKPLKGFDWELTRKDGSKIHAEVSISLIRGSEGQPIGFRGIIRDITEREQAKAEIIYLKEYNEKIVASIPSSLLVLDRNLNIKSVNRTYRETRGIKDEDVVGKNIKEVFPAQLLKDGGLLHAFEEVMATKEPRSLYGVKHASSDHPEKILNITVSGLRRAEEEEEELILVIENITERARLQEEIRKKNEELENFVYIVSHDLKSPIVSMQGFSSMLLNEYREKLGEEGGRYLDRIRANASRMEVLISDLLALSRVGRVVGAFKDVSTLDIVNRVCNGLKSRIEEKRIEVSITDDLPMIHCDADRIYQVFENLVVNAVKFTGDTEKPKIEIGYEERGESHCFYVRDNGIGIDPEYHGKIFEIFQRLKEIEDEEGTGIGLVIVERIVKNHGGRVWVESEKGKGATFYFTLEKMPS